MVIYMEYKSINKYLLKNKKKKSFVSKLLTKLLYCTIMFLICLIVLKYDKNNDKKIYNYITTHNISFAKINKVFKDKFGSIIPFENIVKDTVTPVFNEKLSYSDESIYKDGVKLTIDDNYLVPILESGIVVFKGEKESYGNTIIIEQVNGIDVMYGNLSSISVDMYDYVNKGEYLGEASGSLYLVFSNDGEYLDYKEYIK